jgi:hypothetical protein
VHVAFNADAPVNPHEPYCNVYGKPMSHTCKKKCIFKSIMGMCYFHGEYENGVHFFYELVVDRFE